MATVDLKLLQSTPTALTVKAGTTVTWRSSENITHTVTSGYRTSFGQLINSVVPQLPAVADELKPHVSSLLTAIDASVAKSPTMQSKLAASADHMVMTGGVLASGIAKNKKITS